MFDVAQVLEISGNSQITQIPSHFYIIILGSIKNNEEILSAKEGKYPNGYKTTHNNIHFSKNTTL